MSTDVIELGSSDDDREPEPKKRKIIPNAMVHIPGPHTKLPEITIKSTKNKKVIPLSGTKLNIFKKFTSGTNFRNLSNNQNTKKVSLKPVSLPNKIITNKYSNHVDSRLLKTLPPSITIKKTNDHNTLKIPVKPIHIKKSSRSVLKTIDVVDVPATSRTLPQWYKKPEDRESEKCKIIKTDTAVSIEKRNNTEPLKFIEIVIDDSPVKPSNNTGDISNAMNIADSPLKVDETCKEKNKQKKERQSKKMLDYEKVKIIRDSTGMIEIEVEPIDESQKSKNVVNNVDLQIPQENLDRENTRNKNKKENLLNDQTDKVEIFSKTEKDKIDKLADGELNAIYQKFIETCFNIENSNDMRFIVEKKIKAYYKQCPKEYIDSEEFVDFISGKILSIESSPNQMYIFIRDVVNELKIRRKKGSTETNKKDNLLVECSLVSNDTSEYDSKRQRQIKKLEKTLKKLRRIIQWLEEQEVDLDNDETSVYLLTERYKERFVRIYTKLCQLTQTKLPSEPYIKLETVPGRPKGPATKLEKWINKKVPLGKPRSFPDFHDVLLCVREANSEDKLGWSEMEISEEARRLFIACGKRLKRLRQENEWKIAASRLEKIEDPAHTDVELKKKLDENKMVASKNEAEVLNKYVDRQNQLKLVAKVIDDKEAEESPTGSDDEDDNIASKVEQIESLEKDEKDYENLDRLMIRDKGKYYSESDSETPIDITDSENERECYNSDVISIEDSIYSDLENSMNSSVVLMDKDLSDDLNAVALKNITVDILNGCKNENIHEVADENAMELNDDVINIEKEFKTKSCNSEINNDIVIIDDITAAISDTQADVEVTNNAIAKASTSIDAEKIIIKGVEEILEKPAEEDHKSYMSESTKEPVELITQNATIDKFNDLEKTKASIDMLSQHTNIEMTDADKQISNTLDNISKLESIVSTDVKAYVTDTSKQSDEMTMENAINLEETKDRTNLLDQNIDVEMISLEKQILGDLADDKLINLETNEPTDIPTYMSESIKKSVELTIENATHLKEIKDRTNELYQHTDVEMIALEKQILGDLVDDELSNFESNVTTDIPTYVCELIKKSVELTTTRTINLEQTKDRTNLLDQHTDVEMISSEKQVPGELADDDLSKMESIESTDVKSYVSESSKQSDELTIENAVNLEQTKDITNVSDHHTDVEMIASEKQVPDKLADDELSKLEPNASTDIKTYASASSTQSNELTIENAINLEQTQDRTNFLDQHIDVEMIALKKQILGVLADDELGTLESNEPTDIPTNVSKTKKKSVELTSENGSNLKEIKDRTNVLEHHTDGEMIASNQISDTFPDDEISKLESIVSTDKILTLISETIPNEKSLYTDTNSSKIVLYEETTPSITGGGLFVDQESETTVDVKERDDVASASDLK